MDGRHGMALQAFEEVYHHRWSSKAGQSLHGKKGNIWILYFIFTSVLDHALCAIHKVDHHHWDDAPSDSREDELFHNFPRRRDKLMLDLLVAQVAAQLPGE